ncbi:MAG: hypothetical protein AVDCRST_MAG90-1676, partial [uncultured Microvirga sp.]
MSFTPLDRGQLSVLRVRAAITAFVLLAPIAVLDLGPLRETRLPFGLVLGAAAIVFGLSALLLPLRRYRSWGFRFDEDELHIRSGLWTRLHTI